MPMDYGRGGAKKAQKGRGISAAYQAFRPRDVSERLTGSELEEYQSALATLASPAQISGGGLGGTYLRGQEEAMSTANRLRELAASRAFTDFSRTAMQFSKPWLVQQPTQGLITGQTVPYGLARRSPFQLSFSGEGTRAAPLSPGVLMGEHQFSPIGYQEAAGARRRRRLSELPYGESMYTPTTSAQQTTGSPAAMPVQQQIDLGHLSFGGW